jgi:hypothetical protein
MAGEVSGQIEIGQGVTIGLLVVVRGSGAFSLERLLARVPKEAGDRGRITVQDVKFQS